MLNPKQYRALRHAHKNWRDYKKATGFKWYHHIFRKKHRGMLLNYHQEIWKIHNRPDLLDGKGEWRKDV